MSCRRQPPPPTEIEGTHYRGDHLSPAASAESNTVGGIPYAPALRKQQNFFAMFAQTKKGSLVQRELARQRLRDCKSLEIAEQKRKRVSVRYNPSAALRAAPPLTQGRLRSAPPVSKVKFPTGGRGNPSPTNIGFCQAWAPESPPPGGSLFVCANIAKSILLSFCHSRRAGLAPAVCGATILNPLGAPRRLFFFLYKRSPKQAK